MAHFKNLSQDVISNESWTGLTGTNHGVSDLQLESNNA